MTLFWDTNTINTKIQQKDNGNKIQFNKDKQSRLSNTKKKRLKSNPLRWSKLNK